jgi:predicted transcriptional regulator
MNGSPKAKRNNARLSSLARNAGISPLTVDRIEKGMSCRIETKRKIILAFGYDLSDKGLIFKNC